MIYKKNVGTLERFVRVIAGCSMIACGFVVFGRMPLAWVAAVAGALTVASGAIGFCPACAMLGRRQLSRSEKVG
jgi:hypothetical protein